MRRFKPMPKLQHQPEHPATTLPPEGIANSPFRFHFEVFFLLVFTNVFLMLWLWKIKSFPSHPWYQSVPEFSKGFAGLVTAIGGCLTAIFASSVFIRRIVTGASPSKKMDAVKATYALLKKVVSNRRVFQIFAWVSVLACLIVVVVIVQMPASKQATVFLNTFQMDLKQPRPVGLIISPDNKELYVADEEASRLVVLATSPLRVRHVVRLPDKPHRLAITPDGRTLFVTCIDSGVVYVVERSSYKIVARIPTGPKPYWITVTPDGKKAYVSNQGELLADHVFTGSVSVIDAATNYAVINTISNVNFPEGMDIAKDTGRLYLASQGGWTHEISEMNIPDEWDADKVAQCKQYTADYGNWGGDPVFVIDTATDRVLPEQTISNMEVGVTLAVKPDGTKVYVARGNFNWRGPFKWSDFARKGRTPLGAIDTTFVGFPQKLPDVLLHTSVSCVAMTPDGKYVLAGNGNDIAIIDTTTDRVVNRVKLPSAANDITVGEDGWVYVTVPGKGLLFAFSLKGLV
jgi:YVTN family beta-propeller protein